MDNKRFDGMTANERLVSAGLLEAFDAAANRQDRDALIAVLSEVAVVPPEVTAHAVLTDPYRNGG